MRTKKPTLSIARARREDVADVHDFHQSQLTDFIWPRTPSELDKLADEGSLLVARANDPSTDRECIVGMCYVMHGDEPEGGDRWEFGGLCVDDKFRGYGIGSSLGVLEISSHYLYEPPQKGERLIAHVHIDNNFPRHILKVQLGFVLVGQETPPPEVVPLGLRRNSKGRVTGDLYEFKISTLDKFAHWLEVFDGQVKGRNGRLAANLNIQFFQKYRDTAIQALRQLSSSTTNQIHTIDR